MSTVYPRMETDVDFFQKKLLALQQHISAHKTKLGEASFDKIAAQIKAIEDGLTTFKTTCRGNLKALQEQFEKMSAAFDKLLNRLAALESPPFGKVTFVRFLEMKKLDEHRDDSPVVPFIEVKDPYGRLASVYFLDEKTDVHTLKYGQYLLIATTSGSSMSHVLKALNEFSTEGTVGVVSEELLSDHTGPRFLVSSSEHAAPQIMHAIAGLDTSVLEKGNRILADTATHLILEILPKSDTGEEYLVAEVPDVTFNDIGGLDGVKKEVKRYLIDPILYPELRKRWKGRKTPKGLALVGPPGVGKTMLAKAIINLFHELRCEQMERAGKPFDKNGKPVFFVVNGGEWYTKWHGVPEERGRAMFAQARKLATPETPVCIFFDEFDALAPIRGSGISSDAEKTMVTMLSTEIDGVEAGGNVIVIIASNRMELVDGALLRPGRCDREICIPRPDRAAAVSIFEKYLGARWEEIHPKYNVDVYIPLDRKGKPRADASGAIVRHQFSCDAARAREYLINCAVDHIFEDSARNEVVRLTYENGLKQIVRFRDLLSGAHIANIVGKAIEIAEERFLNSLEKQGLRAEADELSKLSPEELAKRGLEQVGVQKVDLHEAIEYAIASIKVPDMPQALLQWLSIEGLLQGERFMSVEPGNRQKEFDND